MFANWSLMEITAKNYVSVEVNI